MSAPVVSCPLALPWLSPEHVRLPACFNVGNLHPLQIFGVCVRPSAAQLRAAFRQATSENPGLMAKDEAFEDFIFTLRPGDIVMAFSRTKVVEGETSVEDGIALFRSPNLILRQIVL